MKRITNIRTLAALLMASAAIVSCSVKEDIFEEETIIKEEPAKVYTLSVNATKGGDDEATKALSLEGKTLNATWAQNEEVTVYNNTKKVQLDGTLKAQSDGSSTTLKGSLTGTIEKGDELILRFNSADYASQSGTLDYIAANCDFAEASITVSSVDGENNVIPTSAASFVNQQAIVKFILKDQDNNDLNVSNLTISAGSNRLVSASDFRVSKTYYTGYTADAGTGNTNTNGGYDQILDGNTATKWCVSTGTQSGGVWFVEFHTASAVQVDGYKLTTADDTQTYPGRNPKNWTLKAKVNSGDAWTVIDTKTDNTDMPPANDSSVNFETDVQGMYQYFRLEVSTVQSGDLFQLSKMQLYGCSYREFSFRYGNVNVTPAAATNELTVALNNQSGASDTYTLTSIDGSHKYTFTKSGVTFERGKYYAITVKMTEVYKLLSAATTSDYGMVVCADGHLHDAKTAVPAGCTAVGILGKVTKTGYGLILALKDATAQAWDTINRWTSETYYAGTTLKLLPDDAARGTNLTSYTVLGTTAVSNWALAQKGDYEAIFTNLGSTTNSDGMTYDANVNAYITTGVGGTALSGDYWSATEDKLFGAYCFGSGIGWGLNGMSVSYSVRPVLGFGGEAKLLSAASAEDIGKVVCADGHLHDAKTAVPAGCTAVGILGKVTETGHGLILALQDATSHTWNTINNWASATYAGTTLMVLPDDAARANLTSYTTLGETTVSNWAVAHKSDYDAIFFNLGSTEYDINEHGYTYDGNVNAYITTGVGGTALSGDYWSATGYPGDYAWFFDSSSRWYYNERDFIRRVRPVLGF